MIVQVLGASQWTSLEIAKLVVAVLTPVLLFVLGIIVRRAASRVEDAQWGSRKLIERRLELYEEIAPRLNDLFCFFMRVGHFREVEPPKAIAVKRELDRTLHAHAPLFSREFEDSYREFMNACFKAFTGLGEDAKLRTFVQAQRYERGSSWKSEWERMFADGEESTPDEIDASYNRLMDHFAEEVGVRAEERRSRE
jgi:hypothetical protein